MNRWFIPDNLMTDRINDAIKKSNIPLKELALKMGISRNTLYHYIEGYSQMNMVNLRKFCIVTKSNPAYILGMVD